MSENSNVENNETSGKWSIRIAIALLIGAYLVSVVKVMSVKTEGSILQPDDEDRITLHLTHWQLESGVRQALQKRINEYQQLYHQRTGKHLHIIQNAINERVYQQYVQTQCIGGTAPDIVQIGRTDASYVRRFFISNNEDIVKPNPYNDGTDLAGVPWADTYIDGMFGSLDQQTLQYYGVGLSHFTIRIFYNKKILKEALGVDTPPADFNSFFNMCEELRSWAKRKGINGFVPIAGSKYQLTLFGPRYISYLTFRTVLDVDNNNDATISPNETIFGLMKGTYSFESPDIAAAYNLVQRITSFFPPSFMAQNRMESGFAFTSGKAAFIASGAWDANSFFQSANFPVGVCDFPMPLTSDPNIGQYITGPGSEVVSSSGFRLGVTKFSKHKDIAVDFLMFMSSRKNNEKFNREIKWLPLIKGAKVCGVLKIFEPNNQGLWGGSFFQSAGGGRSGTVYNQQLWEFVEQKINYKEFAHELEKGLPRAYAIDLQRSFRETWENIYVIDASFSKNLADVEFAYQYSKTELAKVLQQRVSFLWESRIANQAQYFEDMLTFRNLIDEQNPMAVKVMGMMKENLFENELQ